MTCSAESPRIQGCRCAKGGATPTHAEFPYPYTATSSECLYRWLRTPATTDTNKPAASAAGFVFLTVFPMAWRSVHGRRTPCSAANILAGRIKAKLRQDRAPATRPDDVWAMDFAYDPLASGRKMPVIDTLKWPRTRHAGRPFLPITATKAAKVAHTAAAKKARPFVDHSIASPAAMGPRNAPSPHIRPMAA